MAPMGHGGTAWWHQRGQQGGTKGYSGDGTVGDSAGHAGTAECHHWGQRGDSAGDNEGHRGTGGDTAGHLGTLRDTGRPLRATPWGHRGDPAAGTPLGDTEHTPPKSVPKLCPLPPIFESPPNPNPPPPSLRGDSRDKPRRPQMSRPHRRHPRGVPKCRDPAVSPKRGVGTHLPRPAPLGAWEFLREAAPGSQKNPKILW